MEMTLSKEIVIDEEKQVLLPSGEIQHAPKRPFSLLVDQAYVRIHGVTDPFEFTLGRKNFEDARLWLYDAALDSVGVKLKHGNFQTDASVGRENWRDLDLLHPRRRAESTTTSCTRKYRESKTTDSRLRDYAVTACGRQGMPVDDGCARVRQASTASTIGPSLGVDAARIR